MSSELHSSFSWEPIDGFQSWSEFSRFRTWIDDQLKAGVALELSVNSYYNGVRYVERWFQHIPSKEVWRLIQPEAPFSGVFKRVSDNELFQTHDVPFANNEF